MPRKKDNNEFKQRRNGYNRVYTRYRIPNYKNMTKPTNNTINKQQEKETNVNVNQKIIEMMQTIQQNIKELNITMSYLNQRITKIENKSGSRLQSKLTYHLIMKTVVIKTKTTRLNNYKRNQLMEEITTTRIQIYGINQSTFIIKIQMSIDHNYNQGNRNNNK